ncbi:RHS repeat-associated core domain-containing protein, partial [Rodentibacter caecimuris]|uniref:RHS repeat-associated core domain-containing protein n=1 Tax=Rodentibacter caecimuris TaxID=1796644 RepID=UPI0023EE49D3
LDQETGLHYNFLRYYEPITGRFTTQDPIGLAGGNNLYRFEGTVQNQIDPLGLFVQAIVFAPELIALGKAALVTLGIFGVGVVAEEAMKNREQTSSETKAENTSKCNKPKCPDDVYKQLTEKVEKAKVYSSSLKKCLDSMSNDELQLRINAANMELDARMERENRCWDGGDAGHKEQMNDIQNRIKRCRRYMK